MLGITTSKPAIRKPGDNVIAPTAGSCGVTKDRMKTKAGGAVR